MIRKKNNSSLKIKTLSERANEAYDQGYLENFKVIDKKLITADGKFSFEPREVTIGNTYRFDNHSDPLDTSILYLVETRTGKKGTLIDANGGNPNILISNFVREVSFRQEK